MLSLWRVVPAILPERVAEHFPIEREPKIPTMDKPVIIESACPGWQEGGSRYPAVPCTIEEQVREIVDSIRAGAVAIHVHPRDPKTCVAQVNPKLLQRVLDPVFDEVGDVVTLSHTWAATAEADYITETQELLELGKGNKYCQGSVVLPVGFRSATGAYHTNRTVIEGIKWLEAHDVKPVYQLYDTYTVWHLYQHVFRKGISKWKPYILNLHLGKHHSYAIHKDPWSYMQLITNYGMVKETVPDSIMGVFPGGRNWLPTLVLGLIMGAQIVRVGVEDCYWIYPHRDEIIKKNSDMVELAVDLAKKLGREVVTDPNMAREILGLKLTSRKTLG